MGRFTKRCGVVVCALALFLSTDILRAQEAPAGGDNAGRRGRGGGRRGPRGARSGKANQQPNKPQENKAKPDAKKDKPDDKAKAAEEAPVVKRPTEPTVAPDPNELKQKPDADGKVQLKFRGQPWEGVLNWLADASGLTLDWVEMPAGYLNLTTKGRYTIEQARDMLNARLLSRGFTLLHHDEGLTVVNIKKNLDSSMVPRVQPEELAKRSDYEFVKTSFQLDWLVAETMAKELESMKSKNGTLVPLTTTNRLEAMDAVKNLREIYRLLNDEQSDTGEKSLLRMFRLKNSRASDVVELLQEFLGIESKATAAPMTPQQRQQAAQRARQLAQQQAQKGKKPAAAKKDKPEIHLIAVPRENSILATAPPDKMAIIEKAILAIDAPPQRPDAREFDAKNIISYRVYRLSAINPETLIKTLDDAGDLHFNTRLEADVENNAIIARATMIDHATIGELVARLDSSARKFYVIRLKHLAADYVAGSIEKMMGVEQEQQSRRGGFSFFGRRGRRGRQDEQKDKFSVDADVEFNRLILKANKAEYDAVEGLLVALGEMPREGGNPEKVRFIEGGPDAATLERIIGVMKSMVPNKIQNNVPKEPEKKPAEAETDEKPGPRTTTTRTSASVAPAYRASRRADRAAKPSLTLVLVSQQQDAGDEEESQEAAPPEARKQPPAAEQFDDEALRRILERRRRQQQRQQAEPKAPADVVISRTPDGRLMITSDDPKVLDLFERLLDEMAPPPKDFHWFYLTYAYASTVAYDLEDFFKEGEEKPRRNTFYDYYYGDAGRTKEKGLGRLSKRRPLKFIWDVRTNSILVQGADEDQLRTIGDLIEYYDKPTPVDSESARQVMVYKVRFSKAEVVAEAVKEVFRDLLSANDKSLQKNQKEKGQAERSYTFNYGGQDGKQQQKVPNFKGALSIGVDDLSNTLIVSAPEYVMKPVKLMINELDEAAKPTSTVDVFSVGRGINAEVVQRALSKILGQSAAGGKTDEKSDTKKSGQNQQPNQGNRGQNNGGGRQTSNSG